MVSEDSTHKFELAPILCKGCSFKPNAFLLVNLKQTQIDADRDQMS